MKKKLLNHDASWSWLATTIINITLIKFLFNDKHIELLYLNSDIDEFNIDTWTHRDALSYNRMNIRYDVYLKSTCNYIFKIIYLIGYVIGYSWYL